MKLLKAPIRKLINYLSKLLAAPQMIYGYRSSDGTRLPRVRISNTTAIISPRELKIADNVWIGHYCFIESSRGLQIDEGCQITNYVSILTHSSHRTIRLYGNHLFNRNNHKELLGSVEGPISIGKYTFIGPHTVIMPNSKIGKGVLIAAYSYVNGDVADFAIIAGNPAQVVGNTRKIDQKYLQQHPELEAYYAEWARD